ncbi:hypothetical protein [Formosa sp. S-31]|uniref:hypothetical protein n=1 Tax=Formosa sp. S-31 TaxID=2790949 RepID=UPI003EBA0ADB
MTSISNLFYIKGIQGIILTIFSLSMVIPLRAQKLDSSKVKKYRFNHVTKVSNYSPNTIFSFRQQRLNQNIIGIGYYYKYKNHLTIEPVTDLKLHLEGGIIEQQIYLNDLYPNLFPYYKVGLQYAISNYIQPFLYVQKLEKALNTNKPIEARYIDPVFPQSEFGTGIQSQIQSVLLETGTRTPINSSSGSTLSGTTFFTKLKAKF